MFFLEVMLRLLKCWDADADALLIAGFAGGFLGMVGVGTWRGGLFGASVCAVSAALGITRTASRSDDRVRSLESAIEVCVTDLAKLNWRFSEFHDDTAVIAARVDAGADVRERFCYSGCSGRPTDHCSAR